MRLTEADRLTGEAQRARIHELEGNLNGHAAVVGHEFPMLPNGVQHLFDALTARAVARRQAGALAHGTAARARNLGRLEAPVCARAPFTVAVAVMARSAGRHVLLGAHGDATIAAWPPGSLAAVSARLATVGCRRAAESAVEGVSSVETGGKAATGPRPREAGGARHVMAWGTVVARMSCVRQAAASSGVALPDAG